MECHAQPRTTHHYRVADSKFPRFRSQKIPHLMSEWISSVFDISQHCSNNHDGETDPEQHEEPSEISVFTPWVKVGYPSSVFDSRKDSVLLLRSYLLPN